MSAFVERTGSAAAWRGSTMKRAAASIDKRAIARCVRCDGKDMNSLDLGCQLNADTVCHRRALFRCAVSLERVSFIVSCLYYASVGVARVRLGVSAFRPSVLA